MDRKSEIPSILSGTGQQEPPPGRARTAEEALNAAGGTGDNPNPENAAEGQTSGKYDRYIHGGTWKKIRAACIERDGGKCRMCGGSGNLQVHHASYAEYEEFGEDRGTDHLVTLCRDCHRDVHMFPGILRDAAEFAEYEAHPSRYEILKTAIPDKKGSEGYSGTRNFFTSHMNTVNRYFDISSRNRIDSFIGACEGERRLNAMVAVTDAFIISRCRELNPAGDTEMLTGKRNMGVMADYINGLFGLSPKEDVAELWKKLGNGTPFRDSICATKYNSWRLLAGKCAELRKEYRK